MENHNLGKSTLAIVLCIMLLLAFGASAKLLYYATIEEGFQAIEKRYGPFIGALTRAVGGDYEILDSEYNWEYWLELRSVNVNNARVRDAYLKINNYNEREVKQAVYDSLAESSSIDLRRKAADMRKSMPTISDESIITGGLLHALTGAVVAGTATVFIKLTRCA